MKNGIDDEWLLDTVIWTYSFQPSETHSNLSQTVSLKTAWETSVSSEGFCKWMPAQLLLNWVYTSFNWSSWRTSSRLCLSKDKMSWVFSSAANAELEWFLLLLLLQLCLFFMLSLNLLSLSLFRVCFFFSSTSIMSSVVDVHLSPTQSTKANTYWARGQHRACWCYFLELQHRVFRAAAFNTVAITPMWLLKFKLIKIKWNRNFSSSVVLAIFQVLHSHMWVVPTILDSTDIERFHPCGKGSVVTEITSVASGDKLPGFKNLALPLVSK